MAIKQYKDTLPPPPPKPEYPPDEIPRFGLLLAQAWADQHAEAEPRPHAIEGTKFRLSWAGKRACDLGYWMRGDKPSNPPDLADYWRMNTGTVMHVLLEEAVVTAFPQAEIEYQIDLRKYDVDGSGSGDVFLVDDRGKRIVIEFKTIGGFGFKSIIGRRGPAEGPKGMHLRQAAIQALAMEAHEMVLVYVALENLSQREFDALGGLHPAQKFTAEWTYLPAQYEPIAEAELKRIRRVEEVLAENQLPPRSAPDIPPRARITDPVRGTWTVTETSAVDNTEHIITNTGSTWICGYCSNRDRCIKDGPS